jgi:hypothetical protein
VVLRRVLALARVQPGRGDGQGESPIERAPRCRARSRSPAPSLRSRTQTPTPQKNTNNTQQNSPSTCTAPWVAKLRPGAAPSSPSASSSRRSPTGGASPTTPLRSRASATSGLGRRRSCRSTVAKSLR